MSYYSIKKTKVINWEVVCVSLALCSKNHLGWFIDMKNEKLSIRDYLIPIANIHFYF